MNLEDEIKLAGYFWLPSESNTKLPGTLFISLTGKIIKLEILGMFDEGENTEASEYEIPIICGNVESKNYITLEDSFYRSQGIPFPGIVSKSEIVSNYVYFGVLAEKKADLVFDKFDFTLDQLPEWFGRISIQSTLVKEYGEPIDIKYVPQKKLEYNLTDGDKLIIYFPYSISRPSRFDIQVSQKVLLSIVSEKKKSLNDFIFLSFKIINFFSFAVNETLNIKNVYVSSKDITNQINGKTYPIKIETIYASQSTSEEKRLHRNEMLFDFDDIENTFESKIQNWLQNYQLIEPTMNLYFSVKQGNHTHLESQFLFLIQALETYHRRISNEKYIDDTKYALLKNGILDACPEEHKKWLESKLIYANEISLRKRIKKIIEPFNDLIGTAKERKSLTGKVVDTRNYLTHYNEELYEKAIKDFELIKLNKSLEGLLELSLLKELQFTDVEINHIFKRIIAKKFGK